jgi:DNA repair protein RadC
MKGIKKLTEKIDALQFTIDELTIVRKGKISYDRLPKITSSRDAYDALWTYIKANPLIEQQISVREMVFVTFLNNNHRIYGQSMMFAGGTAASVVDMKLVWAAALLVGAAGIIITHNHPSGNLLPSNADNLLAKNIQEQAKIMEIKLLDFIIITESGYRSYADDGLIN